MGRLKFLLLNIRILNKVVTRILNWGDLFFDYIGIRKNEYIINLRSGTRVLIRPNTTDRGILKEIFILEEYSPVIGSIKNSDIIIDIGAHIGMFSLFATEKNPNVKILAFEPMKKNFCLLSKNISLNNLKNIDIINYAVSDKNSETLLYLSEDNTGAHSMFKKSERSEKIKTISINNIFIKFKIKNCSLLKLDCEGGEYPIIMSLSKNNLKKINSIIMEFHNPKQLPEIINKLKDLGFKISTSNNYDILYAYKK